MPAPKDPRSQQFINMGQEILDALRAIETKHGVDLQWTISFGIMPSDGHPGFAYCQGGADPIASIQLALRAVQMHMIEGKGQGIEKDAMMAILASMRPSGETMQTPGVN